jgi:hypothetical protein
VSPDHERRKSMSRQDEMHEAPSAPRRREPDESTRRGPSPSERPERPRDIEDLDDTGFDEEESDLYEQEERDDIESRGASTPST